MPASRPAACGRPPRSGSPTVTWTPLWDDKDFVTQAAGAIEIDPTNSNVLYVGTGDWAAADQFSEGIMKTADGGAHLDAARRQRLHPLLADPAGRRQPLGEPEHPGHQGRSQEFRTGSWSAPATTSTSRTTPAPPGRSAASATTTPTPRRAIRRPTPSTASAASISTPAAPTPSAYVAVGYHVEHQQRQQRRLPLHHAGERLPGLAVRLHPPVRRLPGGHRQRHQRRQHSPAASSWRRGTGAGRQADPLRPGRRGRQHHGRGHLRAASGRRLHHLDQALGQHLDAYRTARSGAARHRAGLVRPVHRASIRATTRTFTSATSTPSRPRSIRPTRR